MKLQVLAFISKYNQTRSCDVVPEEKLPHRRVLIPPPTCSSGLASLNGRRLQECDDQLIYDHDLVYRPFVGMESSLLTRPTGFDESPLATIALAFEVLGRKAKEIVPRESYRFRKSQISPRGNPIYG